MLSLDLNDGACGMMVGAELLMVGDGRQGRWGRDGSDGGAGADGGGGGDLSSIGNVLVPMAYCRWTGNGNNGLPFIFPFLLDPPLHSR